MILLSELNAGRTLRTDVQHIAAVLAENGLHFFDKGRQFLRRHEVQRGASETAAVDAPCALARQTALGHHQRQTKLLMLRRSEKVLQLAIAAAAAFDDQTQEFRQIVFLQGGYLIGNAAVLIKEVSSAENGPVNIGHIQLFPNHGQAQEELFRLHLLQTAFQLPEQSVQKYSFFLE